MWFGFAMSNEEIDLKYQKVWDRFDTDIRKTIPRIELSTAISEEFDIPNEIADAYISIAFTYYATDWFAVLDNVVRLMRTEMPHDVHETLKATGKEPTVENAKNELEKIKKYYESKK